MKYYLLPLFLLINFVSHAQWIKEKGDAYLKLGGLVAFGQ